jgi:hypothetical protein
MMIEPNNIVSRIEWCRLQQQLPSVTREEREGWRAEEAGLMDALCRRDRTAFMRENHRSECTRYQCGLQDGHALRCFQQFNSRWHDTYGGVGPRPLTPADRRPSSAPPPVHVKARQ